MARNRWIARTASDTKAAVVPAAVTTAKHTGTNCVEYLKGLFARYDLFCVTVAQDGERQPHKYCDRSCCIRRMMKTMTGRRTKATPTEIVVVLIVMIVATAVDAVVDDGVDAGWWR